MFKDKYKVTRVTGRIRAAKKRTLACRTDDRESTWETKSANVHAKGVLKRQCMKCPAATSENMGGRRAKEEGDGRTA